MDSEHSLSFSWVSVGQHELDDSMNVIETTHHTLGRALQTSFNNNASMDLLKHAVMFYPGLHSLQHDFPKRCLMMKVADSHTHACYMGAG